MHKSIQYSVFSICRTIKSTKAPTKKTFSRIKKSIINTMMPMGTTLCNNLLMTRLTKKTSLTLSVLRIFVHFHFLSFKCISVCNFQHSIFAPKFFREITMFSSKKMSFNKFFFNSLISFLN